MSKTSQRVNPITVVAVITKAEKMAWWLAYKLAKTFNGVEPDDVASVVRLAYVTAATTYDTSGPCGEELFNRYAKKAAIRAAYEYCRQEVFRGVVTTLNERRPGGVTPLPMTSLNTPTADGGELSEIIPGREPSETPDLDGWWSETLDGLTETQRTVLSLRYRSGLTQREIADTLGISQMSVWRTIERAAEKKRKTTPSAATTV